VKNDSKISLILYGNLKMENNFWSNWYSFAKDLLIKLSLEPNYCEIVGDTFKAGKLLKEDRVEERIKKSINKGEAISLIGLDVLPDNFSSAFDYIAFATMGTKKSSQFVMLSLPEEMNEYVDFDAIISGLKRFIDITSGEIFVMRRKDNPYFYAMKANPPSSFKSLKVINVINS
jgi:hypothetical protein